MSGNNFATRLTQSSDVALISVRVIVTWRVRAHDCLHITFLRSTNFKRFATIQGCMRELSCSVEGVCGNRAAVLNSLNKPNIYLTNVVIKAALMQKGMTLNLV